MSRQWAARDATSSPPLSRRGVQRADRRERPHAAGAQRTEGCCRDHGRPSRNAAQARSLARPRNGRKHHLPLCSRGDRRRLHRLQRIQVCHLAALVVERLLPILKIGAPQITSAVEPTEAERERAAEAAASAGLKLEPVDTAEADEEAKKFGTQNVDYIYEQPKEELFNGLLPQYIFAMLYHAMAESVAAEHAARMTAMDSATNNASDMIDSYTLQMNRVRQAAITKEIIEIVSGAAAVS